MVGPDIHFAIYDHWGQECPRSRPRPYHCIEEVRLGQVFGVISAEMKPCGVGTGHDPNDPGMTLRAMRCYNWDATTFVGKCFLPLVRVLGS
jgi:hypothetical protein